MARLSRKDKVETVLPAQPPPERCYRTAVYARLSIEDNGRESDSIENQISMIQQYIAQHSEFVVQDIYIDNGYSGTNFDRPRWQDVLTAAQEGKIDCIIVKDLSRLGRNYIETGDFLEKVCPFLGIRFISLSNHFDSERMSDSEQLSIAIANIVNDCYAKDISRKIYSALDTKIRNGDFIGKWEPYGYRRDPENKNHLVIDPETADVVRRIYRMRSEGVSYSGINRILNEEGILSPSQLKAERGIRTNNNQKKRLILWNKHMTTEILNNILYIGHMAQRKGSSCYYAGVPLHRTSPEEWVIVYNTHEPIVSQQLFDKVQSINRKTREQFQRNHGKYDNLPKMKNIYGKKFICGDCGAVMKLRRSFNHQKDKVYFTYNCPAYVEHGSRACNSKVIRASELNEAVLQTIRQQIQLFLDTEAVFRAALASQSYQRKSAAVQKSLNELDAKIAVQRSSYTRTYHDLKSGLLTEPEYYRVRESIDREISRLEEQKSKLSSSHQKFAILKYHGSEWKSTLEQYANISEVTPELLDCLIEQITMHTDGSISIRFRFEADLSSMEALEEELRKEEMYA